MAILRRANSVSTSTIGFPTMVGSYLLLFGWSFVVLFPLYWLAITSFKIPLDVNGGPFYIPWRDFQPTLDNWHYIFVDLGEDTFRPYLNTVVVGLTSTAITLLLGSMAAYGLVRMRYRVTLGAVGSFIAGVAVAVLLMVQVHVSWEIGVVAGFVLFLLLLNTAARRSKRAVGNDDIAFWMISQRMLPPVAVVIPIYIFFQQLELLDTWTALIIAYVASHLPIVVWLMRDYFQSIPVELEESAAIDGASPFRIFRSIVLPLSVPGLVATFLFVLVFAWNEYLIALFLTSANAQTLPLTVAAQNATRGPQWWYMSVLILIMIGPVIAMAIALERFIARGLLVGAVKG
ncbi:MAG TPA: carbohydrate ABC transporter permease [Candidatus Dormibacteraeota bacterium]|nr:carbohydrate ABC transporter permease [Candidatus Dormibacteraeota bacterium]